MKKKYLFIFFYSMLFFLYSQEDVALLIKGPYKNESLDFLGPNAITNYSGKYEYKNVFIEIYYTEEEIVPYKAWANEKTGKYSIKSFIYNDKKIYYYGSASRYHVFFIFAEDNESKKDFFLKYIDRLEYFYRLSLRTGEIPLPAVLNFSK